MNLFGPMVTILVGDALTQLRSIRAESIHMCMTSPPYFGLRDYQHPEQIGLEATPELYVAKLVEIFREVRRVLRHDGTLWLNLGDCYTRNPRKGGDGAGGKNPHAIRGSNDGEVGRSDRPGPSVKVIGLPEKSLIGIPWRVAFALQADGWILRDEIIWSKSNAMPGSQRDRCTRSHEFIFMFSKNGRYFYDQDAIKETAIYGSKGSRFYTGKTMEHQGNRSSTKPRKQDATGNRQYTGFNERYFRPDVKQGGFGGKGPIPGNGQSSFRAIRDTRTKRSVWTVSTKPYLEAHFAVFPHDLIEPCILAGSQRGGIVLDPFGGSGTTAMVARRHAREAVLIELNPAYVPLIQRRLENGK